MDYIDTVCISIIRDLEMSLAKPIEIDDSNFTVAYIKELKGKDRKIFVNGLYNSGLMELEKRLDLTAEPYELIPILRVLELLNCLREAK